MANYRDIKGFTIQSVSSDPVPYVGSWSSGGAMNTTRQIAAEAQIAPQSAGQVAGGGGPGSLTENTEQ